MLKLENINMKYKSNNQEVLKDINVSFPDKGLICIVGESGSGKSTLLYIIAAFLKPTSGSVYLNDNNVSKFKEKELNNYHQNYIGFIFQNYNLLNTLKVKDNILITSSSKNLEDLLGYLNISKHKNKKIKELSGGEAQRVAIARTIINDAQIILADEPTGALDSQSGDNLMQLLKKISQEKLIIMVTHNKKQAEKYADRLITMQDGKIIKDTNKVNSFKINKVIPKAKNKIALKKILTIVINNLKNKLKRNILTTIAFSIGLITLLIVLGINNGFNVALDREEKESLSEYPLYISESSKDLKSEISEIFNDNSQNLNKDINIIEDNHKNIITKEYLNYIKKISNFTSTIEYTYFIDNVYVRAINNNESFYERIHLLSGKKIDNSKEVLLMLDKNNNISSNMIDILKLPSRQYNYEDIIGMTFKIAKTKYSIVGIVQGKDTSFYQDVSGFLFTSDNFKNNIPLEIYIYPKNYNAKQDIINHLKNYKDITFTDYSTTIKDVSKTIINAITVILIVFSFISLIVSTIMISIISYISVLERIHEIGILKSLGFSKRNIKTIFYLENIIISLLSSTISIVSVLLLSIPVNQILSSLTGMENILLINLNQALFIIFISISISLIGSFIPINKTRKLNIIETIKYN